MRPTTAYLPILRRATFSGWSAGSISSLVEADQENGDVVLSALRVGAGHEGLGRLLDVSPGLAHDARDVLVRDHGGEPVRAEDQDVSGLGLVLLHVDLQVRLAPEGARHHVAQGVRPRLVRGDDAALYLLVDPGVVGGELADLAVAHQVDAA